MFFQIDSIKNFCNIHSPVDTGRKLNVHIRRSIYVLCLRGGRKQLCLTLFLKMQAWRRPATSSKSGSDTGIFLWMLQISRSATFNKYFWWLLLKKTKTLSEEWKNAKQRTGNALEKCVRVRLRERLGECLLECLGKCLGECSQGFTTISFIVN